MPSEGWAMNNQEQSLQRILQLKEMLEPYHIHSYMSGDQIDECLALLEEAKRLLQLHHTPEEKNEASQKTM
jgi:hypothetical protein